MILVDTSFWVAWLGRRDPRRDKASELANHFAGRPWMTTNHIVGETWTFLRRRAGHGAAVSFLDAVISSERLQVVRVSAAQEEQALGWLRRHDERSYSFVDATSFTIMRSRRVSEALAFDGDFSAAGFVELRSP